MSRFVCAHYHSSTVNLDVGTNRCFESEAEIGSPQEFARGGCNILDKLAVTRISLCPRDISLHDVNTKVRIDRTITNKAARSFVWRAFVFLSFVIP